jgi:hypothetical protein
MADASARQDILDAIAAAASEIAFAIASLGEAYELLDERTAERLEDELFRPAQAAQGLAQRTHATFAARHGLPSAPFAARTAPAATHGPRAPIDAAVEALGAADHQLSELQDSMLPVEYGDPELRAGLAQVRQHLDDAVRYAREIVRTLGR